MIVLVACEDICVRSETSPLKCFLCFNYKMILVSTPSAGLSFVGWQIKAMVKETQLLFLTFGVVYPQCFCAKVPPDLFINASSFHFMFFFFLWYIKFGKFLTVKQVISLPQTLNSLLLTSHGHLVGFVFCLSLPMIKQSIIQSQSLFATRFSLAQCKHAIVVRRVFGKHTLTPDHLAWLTAVVRAQAPICVSACHKYMVVSY